MKSNPPKVAVWLSRHARPKGDDDALTGDLIERFGEGQTRGWFWKQVLVALAVGVLGGMRRHWPHFCYAIAGLEIFRFLGNTVARSRVFVHWSVLPWPWSQLVFELKAPAILACAALLVLAAALAVNGTFRWMSLLRTAMITLALIALGHFSPDAFPWLQRPVGGGYRDSIIPPLFRMLLFFSMFLVSAWLGCPSAPRAASAGNASLEESSAG